MVRLNHRNPPAALLRAAATGDQEAFALLARRMAPLIYPLVQRFCGDGVEEDDLFQEAQLGLLAAVRRYDPNRDATFTTFATVCIRHRLISAVRHSTSRSKLEQPLNEDTPLPSANNDPAVRLQEHEDALLLMQRLRKRLTPLEFRVLLARLQGRPYQDIATLLRVSKKTVDNAVQRLRRKLSSAL